MLSQDYIMGKLNEFLKTDAGQKIVGKQGSGFTKEEAKQAAEILKQMIIQSTVGLCKSSKGLLDSDAIKIGPTRKLKNGRYKINLTVNQEYLTRDSLLTAPHGDPIGTGVYDIIGLYTQGYQRKDYVFGWWESKNKYTRSHSLVNGVPGLKANNFIDKVIADFKARYVNANIEVTYPTRWHSK